jgi:transcriptional regulator with XRE-family HTH domain
MRLAAELRALRTQAGLTHEQLAKAIGQSRAQISRLENGHVVDQGDIIKILDALEVDGDRWTQIITIAREAGERGWWESNKAMGERQALYANLEAGAVTIREFQMTFVPGLMQTPEFTRARIEAEKRPGTAAGYSAEKVIEARNQRQRMLRRPGGPTYDVIIDELAIRRVAAPPDVLKAQLYHVTARVNGEPKTNVQVLPIDAVIDDYAVPRSAFSIYTFADPDDPIVVAVDTVTDDLVLTDESAVKRYDELFQRLHNAALPVDESLDLLIATANKMRP